MARTHRLTRAGYETVRRTILQAMLTMGLVLVALVGASLHFLARDRSMGHRLILAAGMLLLIAFVLARSLMTALRSWREFELQVSGDVIERTLPGQATVVLKRADVETITETVGKGLVVRGARNVPSIFIPAGLEEYGSVRGALSEWGRIEQRASRQPWAILMAVGAVTIFLLVAPYASDDPLVVTPSSILLALLAAWFAYVTRTNPDFSPRMRRMWWFLLLPALVGLYRAYSVLAW